MYGEIICDGCHSTPAALNNYFMSKGPDYAIMISDALMAKGTPIGSEYIFGGNHITIYPDGSAHLDNGTLAGSTLNINKGLRILVEEAMVPTSSTPTTQSRRACATGQSISSLRV